jgi:hypothetical protein
MPGAGVFFRGRRISQIESVETIRAGSVVVWRGSEYTVRRVKWPEARIESNDYPGAFNLVSLAQLWRYESAAVSR